MTRNVQVGVFHKHRDVRDASGTGHAKARPRVVLAEGNVVEVPVPVDLTRAKELLGAEGVKEVGNACNEAGGVHRPLQPGGLSMLQA